MMRPDHLQREHCFDALGRADAFEQIRRPHDASVALRPRQVSRQPQQVGDVLHFAQFNFDRTGVSERGMMHDRVRLRPIFERDPRRWPGLGDSCIVRHSCNVGYSSNAFKPVYWYCVWGCYSFCHFDPSPPANCR